MSAVESSTAVGTFVARMERWVREGMVSWSYPAPGVELGCQFVAHSDGGKQLQNPSRKLTVMCNDPQTPRQNPHEFLIPIPGDINAEKRPVTRHHAVKRPVPTFLQEFRSVL